MSAIREGDGPDTDGPMTTTTARPSSKSLGGGSGGDNGSSSSKISLLGGGDGPKTTTSPSPLPLATAVSLGGREEPDEEQVFQFKVRLEDTMPPVWRRIQVPTDYTFWGLHCVIQNAMGWNDTHLHAFEVKNPVTGKSARIGKPIEKGKAFGVDELTQRGFLKNVTAGDLSGTLTAFRRLGLMPGTDTEKLFPSWKASLSKYYGPEFSHYETKYTYDFGDNWIHEIIWEGTFPAQPGKMYPVCTDGRQACPPEDCHGPIGFGELLANLRKDPKERTKDEGQTIEWLHEDMGLPDYHPNRFDPTCVVFVNPEMWLEYRKENAI